MIRLEAFEALDAIERYGTFAAAAAALHRVPSAMSYVIGQLESDLGIKVFDRHNRKTALTPAGRLLLEEGRRILEANQELAKAARRLAADWDPELRIAIDSLIPREMIWSALRACIREHPSMRIRLLETTLGGTWEALIDGRADLAIGANAPPVIPSLRQIGRIDVEFVYCCAPGHPLSLLHRAVGADDMRKHPAIVVSDSARHFTPRSASASLLDGQPRLTVDHMSTKLAAIKAGLGVGYCPRDWVAGAAQRRELIILRLIQPPSTIRTDVLRRNEKPSKALRWFVKQLDLSAP